MVTSFNKEELQWILSAMWRKAKTMEGYAQKLGVKYGPEAEEVAAEKERKFLKLLQKVADLVEEHDRVEDEALPDIVISVRRGMVEDVICRASMSPMDVTLIDYDNIDPFVDGTVLDEPAMKTAISLNKYKTLSF